MITSASVETYRPGKLVPVDELMSKVKKLVPDFKARARATERNRMVSRESVDALREVGYYKILQPRAFGGYERPCAELVDLTIEVGRGCASTAWITGIYGIHQWLLAAFPSQAQHDVWDADPDALICGSYAPAGKAAVTDGGYRLSGRWSFASGCDHAAWAFCATILPPNDQGYPVGPAFLLVPARDYLIDDTWDVVGLAGTGSKTLVLDDIFVPAHRVLLFEDFRSGKTPGSQLYAHNPSFATPMLCYVSSVLAAPAIGAAWGALDDYLAMTSKRVTRGAVAGASNKMAEFATVQLRVAEAAASVDAAREVLLRDLRDRYSEMCDFKEVTTVQRLKSRRGHAFSVLLAVRAIDALNASTGGHGLDNANPIQRAWRDVNAVGRHISMNWDAVGTMYGQHALGLPPLGQY